MSEPDRRFTRISRSKDGLVTTLHWKDGKDGRTWDSYDSRFPTFNAAFEALEPYITDPCGFTDAQKASVTVLGVTVERKGEKVGGTLLACRELPGFPSPKAENLRYAKFPDDVLAAVHKLASEADAYEKGNREKAQLEFDDPVQDN